MVQPLIFQGCIFFETKAREFWHSDKVAATILAALNGSLHELRLLLMRDARVTCGLAPSKTAGFLENSHDGSMGFCMFTYMNGIHL